MGATDAELLRQYGGEGNQEAFAELVSRHLPMVTATATRIVKDPVAGEDIAQEVFARLARRWRKVPGSCVLGAWLHADTRWVALQYLRSERRRQLREQVAGRESSWQESDDPDWTQIRPLLDESLERLSSMDRDIVILRFFEQCRLIDVARRLGVSEDAARMRVSRAIERLREQLRSRGVVTTSGALSAALTAHAAVPVPAGVAQTIAGLAVVAAEGSLGSTAAGGFLSVFAMNKSATIAAVAVLAGFTTTIVVQHSSNLRMREELDRWKAKATELELRIAAPALEPNRSTAEVDPGPKPTAPSSPARANLPKPGEGEVETSPSIAWSDGTGPAATMEGGSAVTTAEVEQFLRQLPSDQGRYLGQWRYPPGLQVKGNEPGTNAMAEFLKARELGGKVRDGLSSLEDRPAEFAEFQTAFIESVTGLDDPARAARVRGIIQTAYDLAVSDGLTASRVPATGIEEWGRKRDALDRWATKEVQAVFNEVERQRFDQAFLGVMGIDLGLGDGAWFRFQGPNGSIVFPSEGDPTGPVE